MTRLAGALYRAAHRYPDGTGSLASLAATPSRVVLDEGLASTADLLAAGESRARRGLARLGERWAAAGGHDRGPSTV